MGLIIPSPSVFNLNRVTPVSNPAAHNLSLTSLKLRHTWELHTHPLSSSHENWWKHIGGRERSADHLGSHYTTQAISLCLSPEQQVVTSSVLMLSSQNVQNKRTCCHGYTCCSYALNWPSYRLACSQPASFFSCTHTPAQKPCPLRTLTSSWCKTQIINK